MFVDGRIPLRSYSSNGHILRLYFPFQVENQQSEDNTGEYEQLMALAAWTVCDVVRGGRFQVARKKPKVSRGSRIGPVKGRLNTFNFWVQALVGEYDRRYLVGFNARQDVTVRW